MQTYEDERIQYYLSEKFTSLGEARNQAIMKSKGEFIAFLDCDDWWDPHKLEKQVPLFQHEHVGFVYGNYWVENEIKGTRIISSQNIYSPGRILDDVLKHYTIGMLTLMIRRSAYEELDKGFDGRFSVIGDFDIVSRLAAKWESDYVDEPIAHYRWHRDNYTNTHPQKSGDELEEWYEDIKSHSVISKSNELYNIPIKINYVKGIFYMRNKMKREGFQFLLNIRPFIIVGMNAQGRHT